MKLKLLGVAKGKTAWADEAARDYLRRLKRYGPFEEERIKPAGGQEASRCRLDEAGRVLRRIGPRDRLILLDERGENLSSKAWAALLDQARGEGVGDLVFCIGGPFGHDPSLRDKADRCISLSPMVLNHQVARVVVLEQLYRAWTLLRGEPYHH